MQTPLDYLGFCLWSIVKRDGLLLPGKPALGVFRYDGQTSWEWLNDNRSVAIVRYKDKNCVFSEERYINEFLSDPSYFITGVIN